MTEQHAKPASTLTLSLQEAVQALDFPATADTLQGSQPVVLMPSIDLAVAAFRTGRAPVLANLLFSRQYPQGLIATVPSNGASATNLRFMADLQDSATHSVAWQPGANWTQLPWKPFAGSGGNDVVAPYPASLVKLMVAVGVALAVDEGRCDWPEALSPMITASDNDATDTCVALLHRVGLLPRRLNAVFAASGLPTLQMNNTTAAGGWRNNNGSGVGHLHMTAWDTVRLLWLLDQDAPPPPWLPANTPPLLKPASRDRLRTELQGQKHNEILSSGSLKHVPGWVPGLPDSPAFAHKTGTTENYGSDGGIVKTPDAHYIVAVLSNLGTRYAPHPDCATTWRMPALGAAVHHAVLAL